MVGDGMVGFDDAVADVGPGALCVYVCIYPVFGAVSHGMLAEIELVINELLHCCSEATAEACACSFAEIVPDCWCGAAV